MLEVVDLQFGRPERGRGPLGPLRLTVRPGEVMALGGPSGGGRTQLLQTLAGRCPRLGGEIRWCGRSLDRGALADPTKVALLDEHEQPCAPALPVRHALRLAAGLLGLAAGPRVAAALEQWSLIEAADRRVATLPGGQQELLRLALIDLTGAPIVLIDHPLAHLDGAGRRCLDEWLDRHRAKSGVLLWATPAAVGTAQRIDRTARLQGGVVERLELRGEPSPDGGGGA